MDHASSPVSFEEVQSLAGRCQFYLLRWETEFTPCTGITAVTRQERKYFGSRGVMIAAGESEVPAARAARDQGRVVNTEFSFKIAGPCADGAIVHILVTPRGDQMPIVYLAVQGAFQGSPTPYDTPDLCARHAALRSGPGGVSAQGRALRRGSLYGAADWQTVPALTRLRTRHHTVLTLHNEFDAWLSSEAAEFGGGLYPALRGQETALRAGLRLADVATTVNRGYVRGSAHRANSYASDGPPPARPVAQSGTGGKRQFRLAERHHTSSRPCWCAIPRRV